jgi:hypothetical protein
MESGATTTMDTLCDNTYKAMGLTSAYYSNARLACLP